MATLKAVVFDMDDTLLSINLNAFIGMYALDEANLLAQAARTEPEEGLMATLKAVVFDMDDTLLSINLNAFIGMYALDEANLLAQAARKSTVSLFAPVGSAMLELNNGSRAEGDARTNRQFFADELQRRCGIPLLEPAITDMLEFYEREVLPKKNDRLISARPREGAHFADELQRRCGIPLLEPAITDMLEFYEREVLPKKNDRLISARPREGAHEAVEAVLDRGLRIALLTNPSFSRACIECRMGWGRMLDMPFELVTTWENSTRVKPSAGYYLEALGKLGLSPEETLMVGNDPKRDFPSPDIGLRTAYVGNGTQPDALWNGSMADFAKSLDLIEERFCGE